MYECSRTRASSYVKRTKRSDNNLVFVLMCFGKICEIIYVLLIKGSFLASDE